jgi:hypothetical protein
VSGGPAISWLFAASFRIEYATWFPLVTSVLADWNRCHVQFPEALLRASGNSRPSDDQDNSICRNGLVLYSVIYSMLLLTRGVRFYEPSLLRCAAAIVGLIGVALRRFCPYTTVKATGDFNLELIFLDRFSPYLAKSHAL